MSEYLILLPTPTDGKWMSLSSLTALDLLKEITSAFEKTETQFQIRDSELKDALARPKTASYNAHNRIWSRARVVTVQELQSSRNARIYQQQALTRGRGRGSGGRQRGAQSGDTIYADDNDVE